MNGDVTYIPISTGTGQRTVLLRAAVAAYKNVLIVGPLAAHEALKRGFERIAPGVPFPQCVTAAYVAYHGVPSGADLVLLDGEYPRRPESKFWRALFTSPARVWAVEFGGCV